MNKTFQHRLITVSLIALGCLIAMTGFSLLSYAAKPSIKRSAKKTKRAKKRKRAYSKKVFRRRSKRSRRWRRERMRRARWRRRSRRARRSRRSRRSRRGIRGKKKQKTMIVDIVDINGKQQKPNAQYYLVRGKMRYKKIKKKRNYIRQVIGEVKRNPF